MSTGAFQAMSLDVDEVEYSAFALIAFTGVFKHTIIRQLLLQAEHSIEMQLPYLRHIFRSAFFANLHAFVAVN